MEQIKCYILPMLLFLYTQSCLSAATPDLLVLMHGSGRVERYDITNGKHLGTFIYGIRSPNTMLMGDDGLLYISTGVPGGHGTVERFDARTDRKVDTFISIPVGKPGHLARATGMAWYNGDLMVASQGDGKVKRFDGKTGAWKADVASASPGGLTQIAIYDGRLYLSDFNSYAIRESDMDNSDTHAKVLIQKDGDAPWGLVFDSDGRLFRSTSANRILCFDGKTDTEWAGSEGGLNTPVWLSIGPDGLLYTANLYGQTISVLKTDLPNTVKPFRIIGGTEMQSPISIAFGNVESDQAIQIGNFVEKPSNTGKNWNPTGKTIYNLRALESSAAITDFGIDTEGGDRAKMNLLREPIHIVFTLKDGSKVDSWEIPANSTLEKNSIRYTFSPAEGANAEWHVWIEKENLKMRLAVTGPASSSIAKAEFLIPFNPRAMGTTILAEEWGENGIVKAPLIISALDMGQLLMKGDTSNPKLNCSFTGSRQHKRIDLKVDLLNSRTKSREIVFEPVHLEKPNESISNAEWSRIRRGLISLIHITPYMIPREDGSQWLGSPGGITGNNVISDPVSVNMDRNLQWLAGMGNNAIVKGIDLNQIAKKTIEYWLNQRMNFDGSIDYVIQTGNISADSNTGVLNSATDYYLSTYDQEFVRKNKSVITRAADYLIARDLDNDALIETFRDGNGNNQFGDTGYDTISSGWKNALVNGQAYKSLLGVARMMEDIGDKELASKYRENAITLRKAYNNTFFDKDKNRYIWWIGQDGKRHDYNNSLIQSNAVIFGIADCLKQDTGIDRDSKDVMQALWDSLDAAEYFDSSKEKTIDYIDSKTGNYTGFYWGIPCNLDDVPDNYNFANYGEYEFPYYCNGGIFPQDTVTTIMAFRKARMKENAKIIKKQIFKRQHEGILPNGSGFYMGVVNIPGQCYSILKWDGTPTDYEGIISRDCSFLQTAILTDDPAKDLFKEAKKIKLVTVKKDR